MLWVIVGSYLVAGVVVRQLPDSWFRDDDESPVSLRPLFWLIWPVMVTVAVAVGVVVAVDWLLTGNGTKSALYYLYERDARRWHCRGGYTSLKQAKDALERVRSGRCEWQIIHKGQVIGDGVR